MDLGEGLISSSKLTELLNLTAEEFIFQREVCPSTGRHHYQGVLVLTIRQRHSTLLSRLSALGDIKREAITLDRMRGTFEQAKEYCSKSESRADTETYVSKGIQDSLAKEYKGKDLEVFKTFGFFPWQEEVNKIIFKGDSFNINEASSREVFWIQDREGNSGKSLYTKYLCYNNGAITKLAFGSGSQMRAAVTEEGAKSCYVIDIPRQLCNDDYKNNIFSVIEDLKNGFVKSTMYGKSTTLFMEPPIVIIFSNSECPTEKLSVDRWRKYYIISNKLIELKDERLFE